MTLTRTDLYGRVDDDRPAQYGEYRRNDLTDRRSVRLSLLPDAFGPMVGSMSIRDATFALFEAVDPRPPLPSPSRPPGERERAHRVFRCVSSSV